MRPAEAGRAGGPGAARRTRAWRAPLQAALHSLARGGAVFRCVGGLLLALPALAGALELNDASRAQIEQLNGIGVTTAQVILEERERAPFRDWIDLSQRVKGLSGKRIEQLQAQGVTVNGVAGSFTARVPRGKDGK
jgi:competence protein ComEA